MNILFIIPKLTGGGAERVVARLASMMCEEHTVHILCVVPREGHAYDVDERVQVHSLSVRPARSTESARRKARIEAIRELKRAWKIDVSISFLLLYNDYNVCSRVGETVITSVRADVNHEYNGQWLHDLRARILLTRAARRSDAAVGVSRAIAETLEKRYHAPKGRTLAIYNPCDGEALRAQAAQQVEQPGFEAFRAAHDFLFVNAGRLVPQKGQWHLIRALRAVRGKHPGAGLVILGTGPMEAALRQVAEACGVEEHVYFAGFAANPFAFYGRCDAFAFPSLFEGFPNAALEAMGCGLPVISCDCPTGPRELLAPQSDFHAVAADLEEAEYGLLTPLLSAREDLKDEPLEPEEAAFARGMLRLMEDESLRARLRQAGLRRADQLSPQAILKEWYKCFVLAGVRQF